MSGLQAPESDILADAAQAIKRRWPSLETEDVDELIQSLRHRWGGERAYIRKDRNQAVAQRNADIRTARDQGLSVADIAARMRCSRSQVERALGWK